MVSRTTNHNDMSDLIQIKCPFCGALLSVRNLPGIKNRNITCPICKQTNRFGQYRTGSAAAPDQGGRMPGGFGSADEATQYGPMNFNIGRLRLQGTAISFQLRPGKNEIGRKTANSTVDFQIDTGEHRRMSRRHLVVEVVKEPHKGFVHYVSLSKENVNPTMIDGNPLHFGVDRVILRHGALIGLPDAELRFELPDEDATELNCP